MTELEPTSTKARRVLRQQAELRPIATYVLIYFGSLFTALLSLHWIPFILYPTLALVSAGFALSLSFDPLDLQKFGEVK